MSRHNDTASFHNVLCAIGRRSVAHCVFVLAIREGPKHRNNDQNKRHNQIKGYRFSFQSQKMTIIGFPLRSVIIAHRKIGKKKTKTATALKSLCVWVVIAVAALIFYNIFFVPSVHVVFLCVSLHSVVIASFLLSSCFYAFACDRRY